MNDHWIPRWILLCDKCAKDGYDTLSRNEKAWINVRALIDSVKNGGVTSYFYNSAADTYPDCIEALYRLGAVDEAGELERFANLFGDSVPNDINRRNDTINSWPDFGHESKVSSEVEAKLMPLMKSLEHKLEMFLDDKFRHSL